MNSSNFDVSVVVPVHNTGRFITECLDSLCGQSIFNRMEVLCIDSSTDNTFSLVKNYSDRFSNIIAVKDDNTSYGYKINKGISLARGKYLGIVDSDDFVAPDMYEKLLSCIQMQKVDFVKADYSSFINDNGHNKVIENINNLCKISLYSKKINCLSNPEVLYCNGVSIWTGLYSVDFLRDKSIKLFESEGASFQDTGFSVLTHVLADSFYYTNEYLYCYRIDNPNSSVKSNKKYNLIKYERDFIDDELKKRDITDKDIIDAVKIDKLRSYRWNYCRLEKEYAQKFFEEISEEIDTDYIQSGFYTKVPPEYSLFQDMILKNKLEKFFRENEFILVSAGKLGKRMLSFDMRNNYNSIKHVFDNSISEVEVDGKKITVSPPKKMEDKYNYLIMNKFFAEDLYNQLLKLGIKGEKITVFHDFPF